MKSIKGFTLVELLAVIVILSLLALLAGTAVTKLVKDSKEDLYNTQLIAIKESAQIWGAQNMSLLPNSGECIYITLKTLIDSGIMEDVIDPRTKEPMDKKLKIKISSSTSSLGALITKYEVNPTSVSGCINLLGDTTPPEIEDVVVENGKITITATDNSEDTLYYYFDDGNDYVESNTATVTESKTYNLKVKDAEGNVSETWPVTVNLETNCAITYKPTTPNKPDVTGLTPVKYNGTNWVVTTSDDPEWYDYTNQKWANSVILKGGVNKNVGDIITLPTSTSDTTDVKAILVWIPRYEYKIDGDYGMCGESKTLPGAIDIQFIPIDKKEADENYIIHPAFTFGDKELSGIWVGKFETTGDATNPTVLPNQQSLVSINAKTMFDTAQKLSSTYFDSHMAKNSEWGAVAYLSQSKYGKYGNPNYEGANKEIYKNDSGEYINEVYYARYTGRSSGKPPADEYSKEGTCTYDNINISTKEKATLCGEGASTTGNITGVYDMSGGAWEYVMGYVDIGAEEAGEEWGSRYKDGIWENHAGFTTLWKNTPSNSKYYKEYQTKDRTSSNASLSETACDGEICYGEALSETRGWYGDSQNYPYSVGPWFKCGGYYGSTSYAGVFSFYNASGNAYTYGGFRVVLSAA